MDKDVQVDTAMMVKLTIADSFGSAILIVVNVLIAYFTPETVKFVNKADTEILAVMVSTILSSYVLVIVCPGGETNPCNGHGSCNDGVSGSGMH